MVNSNADFLDRDELESFQFKDLGKDVLIHRSVVLVRCEAISLGDHVRIDPFCVLSSGEAITLERNVHIASHCTLSGSAAIRLGAFSGLSQGVRIFSASDDYSGQSMTNPTVPQQFRNVKKAPVIVGRHAIIGSGCVILPGSIIEEGAAVGAQALVKGRLSSWTIYGGVPARSLRRRSEAILEFEARYLAQLQSKT